MPPAYIFILESPLIAWKAFVGKYVKKEVFAWKWQEFLDDKAHG